MRIVQIVYEWLEMNRGHAFTEINYIPITYLRFFYRIPKLIYMEMFHLVTMSSPWLCVFWGWTVVTETNILYNREQLEDSFDISTKTETYPQWSRASVHHTCTWLEVWPTTMSEQSQRSWWEDGKAEGAIKRRRMAEPSETPNQMEVSCTSLPTVLEETHGYHREYCQRFTMNLDSL